MNLNQNDDDILNDVYDFLMDLDTKRVRKDADTLIQIIKYTTILTERIERDAQEIKQIIIELYNQQKI